MVSQSPQRNRRQKALRGATDWHGGLTLSKPAPLYLSRQLFCETVGHGAGPGPETQTDQAKPTWLAPPCISHPYETAGSVSGSHPGPGNLYPTGRTSPREGSPSGTPQAVPTEPPTGVEEVATVSQWTSHRVTPQAALKLGPSVVIQVLASTPVTTRKKPHGAIPPEQQANGSQVSLSPCRGLIWASFIQVEPSTAHLGRC